MTGREINLLEPGDYLISSLGEICVFLKVASYVRSKADGHILRRLPSGYEMTIHRSELFTHWQIVSKDDRRVNMLRVLYGPF